MKTLENIAPVPIRLDIGGERIEITPCAVKDFPRPPHPFWKILHPAAWFMPWPLMSGLFNMWSPRLLAVMWTGCPGLIYLTRPVC